MAFKVTSIIDGDTFKVSPKWTWNGQEGDTVRANGYNTPEQGQPGYQAAKEKLERLILGKYVELKNSIKISYGRLLCDVYIRRKKFSRLFPWIPIDYLNLNTNSPLTIISVIKKGRVNPVLFLLSSPEPL